MVTIHIPASLTNLTGGAATVQLSAVTVRAAFVELERRHPGINARLLDDDGAVKPFIRVYVGAEDIAGMSGLDSRIEDRDEITIISAIAGG